jgi:hypothetical protein
MMKKTIILLFISSLLCFGSNAADRLKLTLVPKPGKYKIRDNKPFEFKVENTSNEPVTVIVPLDTEPYWGRIQDPLVCKYGWQNGATNDK